MLILSTEWNSYIFDVLSNFNKDNRYMIVKFGNIDYKYKKLTPSFDEKVLSSLENYISTLAVSFTEDDILYEENIIKNRINMSYGFEISVVSKVKTNKYKICRRIYKVDKLLYIFSITERSFDFRLEVEYGCSFMTFKQNLIKVLRFRESTDLLTPNIVKTELLRKTANKTDIPFLFFKQNDYGYIRYNDKIIKTPYRHNPKYIYDIFNHYYEGIWNGNKFLICNVDGKDNNKGIIEMLFSIVKFHNNKNTIILEPFYKCEDERKYHLDKRIEICSNRDITIPINEIFIYKSIENDIKKLIDFNVRNVVYYTNKENIKELKNIFKKYITVKYVSNYDIKFIENEP